MVSPRGVQTDQYNMPNSRYAGERLQDKPDTSTCQQDDCRGQKQISLMLFNVQESLVFSQYPTIENEQNPPTQSRSAGARSDKNFKGLLCLLRDVGYRLKRGDSGPLKFGSAYPISDRSRDFGGRHHESDDLLPSTRSGKPERAPFHAYWPSIQVLGTAKSMAQRLPTDAIAHPTQRKASALTDRPHIYAQDLLRRPVETWLDHVVIASTPTRF